jgi:hypothetical protein
LGCPAEAGHVLNKMAALRHKPAKYLALSGQMVAAF